MVGGHCWLTVYVCSLVCCAVVISFETHISISLEEAAAVAETMWAVLLLGRTV